MSLFGRREFKSAPDVPEFLGKEAREVFLQGLAVGGDVRVTQRGWLLNLFGGRVGDVLGFPRDTITISDNRKGTFNGSFDVDALNSGLKVGVQKVDGRN